MLLAAPRPAGPAGRAGLPAGFPVGGAGSPGCLFTGRAGAGILPADAVAAVEVLRVPGCDVAVLLVRAFGGGALDLRAVPAGGGEVLPAGREPGFAAALAPHVGRGLGSTEEFGGREGEEESVGSALRELVVLPTPDDVAVPIVRPRPAPAFGDLSDPPGALDDVPVLVGVLRGASSGLLDGPPEPLLSIATLGMGAAFFGFLASGSEAWLRPKGEEFPDPWLTLDDGEMAELSRPVETLTEDSDGDPGPMAPGA